MNDKFLSTLVEQLSQEPRVALNPNCLSERTLYSLFDEILEQGASSRPSKEQATEWLKHIGLLTPIDVDPSPDTSKRSTRFYRLDVSKKAQSQTSPVELLQAYDASAVICYFTAIAFHSLSTHPPTHHHLAIPTEPRTSARPLHQGKKRGAQSGRKKPDPLGRWLFTFKGLRYYQTSREKRLIPGIQTRYIGPKSLIRVTVLEQTLLDTLHRPLSCGGPSVVMEAWEQSLSRMNEDKLEKYLKTMDHLPIVQRLGYILGNLGHKPGASLKNVLNAYLGQLNPNDPSVYQQLFPGVKYEHLQRPWMVYGPS